MGSQTMSTPQRVLDSIRRIVRILREGSRVSEERVGLSAAQLFVLQKLDPVRPLSLNELAARTLTHQSSVSVVVSRLVELGLVQRRANADDARRLELLPTRRGLALLRRAPAASQDRIIAAIEELSPAKRRALAASLETLVAALGVDERAAPMLFDDEPARRRRGPKRGNKRA
ncbi:MAG: MarR family transcriptional regulator [Myxococcales bacterium]|nr:MarR family transcriptional regulator [Myxococcales bacterium]